MNNILLTADWHIANYPDYNFSDRSRLNQFPKLAERMIELAKENYSNSLIIAGDLVDVPTMSPVVLHTVKDVITILKSYFKDIYYILGQHDLATKSKTQNIDDTAISIFDGLTYMHQKTLEFNNCIIGFQNWTKDQDTSWIDKHLDFLIGHYTKSKLFGQTIDESKFDYMIHGDIHNDQEIDKFISIGNPIQKDMSSLGNGSVILLDTDLKTFKRLRVDEDHSRFLRIDYTDDEDKEGFLNPLQYYIYKPKNVKSKVDSDELVDLTELDDLINHYMTKENLVDIHSECSAKCNSSNDIDFNFKLIKLKIHGYRSIEDFELNFQDNDRILLLGNNGSGKSSVMNGLNDLFTYNRYLKNQKSDFTEDILLELTLFYQNKTYIIKKGNEWGLMIDGNQIGYNNKTEFEDDLINRLPFLKYSDLFFIHSGTSNLSEQLNIDRKVELITKFYRLNKLDSLSSTAKTLSDNLETEINSIKLSIRDKESQKSYIVSSINQIPNDIKTLKTDDLVKKLNDFNQLREKKLMYDDWKNKMNNLNSQLDIYKSTLSEKQSYLLIDINDLQSKLSKLEEKLIKNSDDLLDVNTKWNKWIVLHKKLTELLQKGKELRYKRDELVKRICPTCHRQLNDTPEHKHLIDKSESELYEVREEFKATQVQYNELLGFKPDGFLVDERFYIDKSEKLLDEKNQLLTYKSSLQTKINMYNNSKTECDRYEKIINNLVNELNDLTSMKIDEVKLPDDLTQQEKDINYKLNKLEYFNDLTKEVSNLDKEIIELKDSIEPKKIKIERLEVYSQLTGRTGKIIESILMKLAESFSSEKVMYKVNSGISRNNHWIKFESWYKVKNTYRPYESLSDGQKNISDLDFLSKLFSSSKVGLLALDEYLKHLDENNSSYISEILSNLNVNTLMISTHSSNYPIFTKRIFLELGSDGRTKSTVI